MTASLFRYEGALGYLSDSARSALMLRAKATDVMVRESVAELVCRVKRTGDSALLEMAEELDGVTLPNIEVPRRAVNAALASLDPALRSALERSARNIRAVHSAAPPVSVEIETEPGVVVGRRPDAVRRIGVYAPGGRAAYASSVLMCAIPARVAGVKEVIVCSPPCENGYPSQVVLAACAIAGVDRVFALGGAGAIAAMAFGTQTIPAVDKIVGPGNAFVAEAKNQVSRIVGIDSPAGPSELLVICDETSNAEGIAAEILAQAEHDPDACVVVIAIGAAVAGRIDNAVRLALPVIARADVAAAALRANGGLFVATSSDEALAFSADYAPEHLLLAVSDAERLAPRAMNAGCVFIGEASSVVFGDYITGGNHVLPTAGAARSFSGLGTSDFIRWSNYQRVSPDAAARLSGDAVALASAEGLGAHAAAARRWSPV